MIPESRATSRPRTVVPSVAVRVKVRVMVSPGFARSVESALFDAIETVYGMGYRWLAE